ncbi:MAG: hypothetical protein FWE27_04605 [Defluviitaleaceae bacterium]|nr:hypothetical protein [Defluviitaleaceae bacterium]
MRRIKMLISVFLAFVMTIASVAFPTHLLAATGNHHYNGNGFEILRYRERYTVWYFSPKDTT